MSSIKTINPSSVNYSKMKDSPIKDNKSSSNPLSVAYDKHFSVDPQRFGESNFAYTGRFIGTKAMFVGAVVLSLGVVAAGAFVLIHSGPLAAAAAVAIGTTASWAVPVLHGVLIATPLVYTGAVVGSWMGHPKMSLGIAAGYTLSAIVVTLVVFAIATECGGSGGGGSGSSSGGGDNNATSLMGSIGNAAHDTGKMFGDIAQTGKDVVSGDGAALASDLGKVALDALRQAGDSLQIGLNAVQSTAQALGTVAQAYADVRYPFGPFIDVYYPSGNFTIDFMNDVLNIKSKPKQEFINTQLHKTVKIAEMREVPPIDLQMYRLLCMGYVLKSNRIEPHIICEKIGFSEEFVNQLTYLGVNQSAEFYQKAAIATERKIHGLSYELYCRGVVEEMRIDEECFNVLPPRHMS